MLDARVYGTCFLIVMCLLVFIGVKWVNKSASVFLAVTLFAILSIFVGFFVSSGGPSGSSPYAVTCMYGDILMDRPSDGLCNKYAFNTATGEEIPNEPSGKKYQSIRNLTSFRIVPNYVRDNLELIN